MTDTIRVTNGATTEEATIEHTESHQGAEFALVEGETLRGWVEL